MSHNIASERRFDIDWLRVIAIGLLLIYHIAIGFQPWGVFIGFIQNNDSLEWIWYPMSMLNIWRIPLLFFVSGMGVYFAIQSRNWQELITERSRRILLPFIFGMLVIVPLHILLWQKYYLQDLHYVANPAHLWFLGNIFAYVIILSPIFFYLKKHPTGKFQKALDRIFSNPLGLVIFTIPFMAEASIMKPESFELYAMTYHGFWLGMIAFIAGFCIVYSGLSFWISVSSWRWVLLGLALILYSVRLIEFDLKGPSYLMAIESNVWIFTVFGFGYKYLNHPSKALTYLSQAAYPIYILHMIFLYLASALIFNTDISGSIKFLIVIIFTTGGCFISYEFIIRRIKLLRPFFGLKL